MTIDLTNIVYKDIPPNIVCDHIKQNAIKYIQIAYNAYNVYLLEQYVKLRYSTILNLKDLIIYGILSSTLNLNNNSYTLTINRNIKYNDIIVEEILALVYYGNTVVAKSSILKDAFIYALGDL
nr:MAG TPA: hypothetical protein [Caudoviricetes sp.]